MLKTVASLLLVGLILCLYWRVAAQTPKGTPSTNPCVFADVLGPDKASANQLVTYRLKLRNSFAPSDISWSVEAGTIESGQGTNEIRVTPASRKMIPYVSLNRSHSYCAFTG